MSEVIYVGEVLRFAGLGGGAAVYQSSCQLESSFRPQRS
jgi:hypothetical protein